MSASGELVWADFLETARGGGVGTDGCDDGCDGGCDGGAAGVPEVSPLPAEWRDTLWARWRWSYGVSANAAGDARLRPLQRDAAAAAWDRIVAWNTCLVCDPVGSGKSYTAMGVALQCAAQVQGQGGKGGVTVVCPRPLVSQWQGLLEQFGTPGTVWSDGVLSRRCVEWSEDGLLIIDEAHRYRNAQTARHRNLAASAAGRRMLLLTATPVWNRRSDLVSLVALGLSESACRWLVGMDMSTLRSTVDAEGGAGSVAYEALRESLVVRSARAASMRTRREVSMRPAVVDAAGWAQVAAGARAAMFGAGEPASLFERVVARRLASSPAAGLSTLRRGLAFVALAQEAASVGRTVTRSEALRILGPCLAGGGSGVGIGLGQGVLSFWFHVKPGGGAPEFGRLRRALEDAILYVEALEPGGAGKLRALWEFVGAHRKTVVFTEYADTARAVAESAPSELRWVWVGSARCVVRGVGRVRAEEAWRVFRDGFPYSGHTCDFAVTTPTGSEGLNLQGADAVVHYDLPWNPARLEQRVGRVDRLGGVGVVDVLTLKPDPVLETVFGGEEVLKHKVALTRPGVLSDGALRTAPLEGRWVPAPLAVIMLESSGALRPFAFAVFSGVGSSLAQIRVAGVWRRCAARSVLACAAPVVGDRVGGDINASAVDVDGWVGTGLPPWCLGLLRPVWVTRAGASSWRARSKALRQELRNGLRRESAGVLVDFRPVGADVRWRQDFPWDERTIPTWYVRGVAPEWGVAEGGASGIPA